MWQWWVQACFLQPFLLCLVSVSKKSVFSYSVIKWEYFVLPVWIRWYTWWSWTWNFVGAKNFDGLDFQRFEVFVKDDLAFNIETHSCVSVDRHEEWTRRQGCHGIHDLWKSRLLFKTGYKAYSKSKSFGSCPKNPFQEMQFQANPFESLTPEYFIKN